MSLSERENYLRTLDFRCPEWIPVQIEFAPATWHKYREDLEQLFMRHPLVFRDYQRGDVNFDEFGPAYREGEYYADHWGCVWHTPAGQDGLKGQVVEHPLANWAALSSYQAPEPMPNPMPDSMARSKLGANDWAQARKDIAVQKRQGKLTVGSGDELFTRLYFLRGFENLMIDIATDAPQLPRLIEILMDYEMRLVNKWSETGVDMLRFHTDIGTQNALMISPEKFRKYIKPMFMKIFRTCRDAGIHVFLSSDGVLLEIIEDLVLCGVSIHDPQIRANTLAGIVKAYKGRMAVKLDLDGQMFPFCKPADIQAQVREAVTQLGSPQGGLEIYAWVSPDVPLGNIETIAAAAEEFRTYWWDGRG